ncbi:MAG: hypothetical protein A2Y10_18590 [Planctomycetes bacterium GWF2_41_51]|nr:MAG: hypothetical protein A2Y10_18590 [Planctomycetes bacterium GWF2_41_51]HBG27144.1 sodium:solute symporter [Phycisphaerales bacterium]
MEYTINYIDITVITIHLAATFILGIFGSRILKSNSKESEGYFLAGRNMPGWLTGISFAATAINADVAPAYVGMAVIVGLPICWFYLSRFGFMMLIAGLLFFPLWRRLKVSTGPEFFSLRFSGGGGIFVRLYTSLWSVCFGMIPWIGAGLLGIHMILAPYLHIEDKTITLLIIIPMLLLYIWIAGFSGVLITDFLQAMVIIFASVILCVTVLVRFGGPQGLADSIIAAMPEKSGEILSIMPVMGHRALSPLIILGWFFLATIGKGGTVEFEGQRVLSCSSSKEAVKVSIWGLMALFVILLLLTLPALGALALHPKLYTAGPVEREMVYGMMLSEFLPTGMRGIALAALVAAVMSTISGHLSYGSQTLVNDVAIPLTKSNYLRTHQVWFGRIFMLVIMLASIMVVYFATSLIGIAITVIGLFSSVALMNWAQWWWWRINIYSWITANVFGPVIYLSSGFILQNFDWWQQHMAMDGTMQQQLGLLKAAICVVINTLVWFIVTLLTQPEDMSVLKKFYLKAKPMGYWGPIKKQLELEGHTFNTPKGLISGGLCTVLCGFIWMSLLILGLSLLYVGRYIAAVFILICVIVFIIIFKRLFDWHMKRMGADANEGAVKVADCSREASQLSNICEIDN